MTTERQAWERKPGESGKAYAWFIRYRDLDPEVRSLNRTLSQAYAGGTKTVPRSTLAGWSTKYGWVDRCRAWDDHQDALIREHLRSGRARMARRQVKYAIRMQEASFAVFELFAEAFLDPAKAVETKAVVDQMGPVERAEFADRVRHIFRMGFDVERIARGEASDAEMAKVAGEVAEDLDRGDWERALERLAEAGIGADEMGLDDE